MRLAVTLGFCAAALAFVVACGSDDASEDPPSDEAQVRAVAEEFNAAWREGDGERACDLLNPESAEQFNVPCQRYFSKTGKAVKEIRIEDVRVNGDEALVRATRLDAKRRIHTKLVVRRIDGEWLVSFG